MVMVAMMATVLMMMVMSEDQLQPATTTEASSL